MRALVFCLVSLAALTAATPFESRRVVVVRSPSEDVFRMKVPSGSSGSVMVTWGISATDKTRAAAARCGISMVAYACARDGAVVASIATSGGTKSFTLGVSLAAAPASIRTAPNELAFVITPGAAGFFSPKVVCTADIVRLGSG